MSQKAQILLLFVIFIIIIILGAGLVLIANIVNGTNQNINDDRTGNINNQPINELDPTQIIGGNMVADYKYAVINSDDTVTLFTEDGKRYDLFLQRQSWSDIAWSPDSSIISVKAKRDRNSVLDLRYFFLFNQTNRWITDYSISRSGVGEYFWFDDETTYFMQGEGSNKWLHRYYYPSIAEILKKYNTNSVIRDVRFWTDDGVKKYLVLFKNNNSNNFEVVNFEGEIIWNSRNLVDANDNSIQPIDARFMLGTNKIIITAEENGVEYFYKASIDEDVVVKLENILHGEFISSVNADEFISVRIEGIEDKVIVFESVDSLKDVASNIAEYAIGRGSIDIKDFSYTKDGNIIFAVLNETGTKSWFELKDKRIREIKFLNNAKEVKIAPRFGGEIVVN